MNDYYVGPGEYEVYYLGNYHETKVFDYKLEHERPYYVLDDVYK